MSTVRPNWGQHVPRRELQRIYGEPPVELPERLQAAVARLEEAEKPLGAEGHVSRMLRQAIQKLTRS